MKRSKNETRFVILAFFGVLVLPWIAGFLGVRPTTVDNRPLASFPKLDKASFNDASFFRDLGGFLVDHTPLRQQVAAEWTSAQYRVTGASPVNNVFIGTDGTLFLSQDFLWGCRPHVDPLAVVERIDQWNELANQRGANVVMAIAPDKGAIETRDLSRRARLARPCSVENRERWELGISTSDAFLPLWDELRAIQSTTPRSLYFRYDSHWTFEGASVYASSLVDHFTPNLWDQSLVVEGEPFQVKSDIARRLGWYRTEDRPVWSSERPGVTTSLDEVDVGGTRTVRRYVSKSSGEPLIAGRTLLVHDSMTNFAELQLAPYFEDLTFIHWDDLGAANFYDLVAEADQVVFEVVERNSHVRASRYVMDDDVDSWMRSALSAP